MAKTPESDAVHKLRLLRGKISDLIAAQRAAERAASYSGSGTMHRKLVARDKAWKSAAEAAQKTLIEGYTPAAPASKEAI